MPAGLVPDLYERHAEAWDRARGGMVYEQPWLDRLLEWCPPAPHVLDVGCGSGRPVGQYLIRAGCQLTGIDTAASLIAMCRARFPSHQWQVSDMRTLALDCRFEAVVAWCSLFHLPAADHPGMFAIFAQHLRPGGILLVTTGDRDGESIGQFCGEPLYHASLTPDTYRDLLHQHRLTLIDHVVADLRYGALTIWLARKQTDTEHQPPQEGGDR